MVSNALLLKATQIPTYLYYQAVDLVIRSAPASELKFYAKIRGGAEHLVPHTMEIMKTAIRQCIEITREEYDAF